MYIQFGSDNNSSLVVKYSSNHCSVSACQEGQEEQRLLLCHLRSSPDASLLSEDSVNDSGIDKEVSGAKPEDKLTRLRLTASMLRLAVRLAMIISVRVIGGWMEASSRPIQ